MTTPEQPSTHTGIPFENFAGHGWLRVLQPSGVVDENGIVIYEWIAPNLGTEPNYDEVVAAIG